MKLKPPVPLGEEHELGDFHCAEPELNAWLKQRALANQPLGASRCYVVCEGREVVGYYALSAGAILRAHAPGAIRRNMPEPIPVVLLARLAVHEAWAGRGIGAGMLKDAVARSIRLSWEVGVRALQCHAINENAKQFYRHHDFLASPIEPMMLMLNLAGRKNIKAVPDESGSFLTVQEPRKGYRVARKR